MLVSHVALGLGVSRQLDGGRLDHHIVGSSLRKLEDLIYLHVAEDIAALKGVDAVFLDATDKPPATIEWE